MRKWTHDKTLFVDTILKYGILVLLTIYIGILVFFNVKDGIAIELPDWLVALFTIVFQYFFRKSPRK